MARLQVKRTFFLGLLFMAPITITLWALISVVRFIDSKFSTFVPEGALDFPGSGILAAIVVLFVSGLLASTMIGRYLTKGIDELFRRVPILRSLYKLLQQVSNAFWGQGNRKRSFQKVVLVPFPNSNTKALAFVTGELETGEVLVFLPTAPNPTSGYVLAFDPSQVKEEKMSVDEAIKIIVSCGASTYGG